MELVTIEIDLCRTEPLRIRRFDVEKITNGYVHMTSGGSLRRKRLFAAEADRANRGIYILTSDGEHATDDEIRLGVETLLGELRKQLQTCWDMEARIREEWLGEVTE